MSKNRQLVRRLLTIPDASYPPIIQLDITKLPYSITRAVADYGEDDPWPGLKDNLQFRVWVLCREGADVSKTFMGCPFSSIWK